jgi:hypothetical protein
MQLFYELSAVHLVFAGQIQRSDYLVARVDGYVGVREGLELRYEEKAFFFSLRSCSEFWHLYLKCKTARITKSLHASGYNDSYFVIISGTVLIHNKFSNRFLNDLALFTLNADLLEHRLFFLTLCLHWFVLSSLEQVTNPPSVRIGLL